MRMTKTDGSIPFPPTSKSFHGAHFFVLTFSPNPAPTGNGPTRSYFVSPPPPTPPEAPAAVVRFAVLPRSDPVADVQGEEGLDALDGLDGEEYGRDGWS